MRINIGWVSLVEVGLAAALQLAIAAIVIAAFRHRQWLVVFSGVAVLLLSFLPALIERHLRVQLPVEITLVCTVFLYASFGLGEVNQFYDRFWWWDLMLHGFSALITGIIGFLAFYVFYMTHRVRVLPIYVAFITFACAVAVGTLWEIFEFLADWFLGTSMQRSGLVDTMTDLMINALGALIAAGVGYYYVRDGDSLLANRLIRALVERGRRSVATASDFD